MVRVGDPAPEFTLESDTGETVRLSDLRGAPVVLYFYPKDETSGCTKQACDIRDNWSEFERLGATVLGVSPDSAESHAGFRAHHHLPFPLLVDSDHGVAEAYGAWGEKRNYGRTYMGIIRSGFVIDPDGNLAAVKHNVKAARHREWALAELGNLAARAGTG